VPDLTSIPLLLTQDTDKIISYQSGIAFPKLPVRPVPMETMLEPTSRNPDDNVIVPHCHSFPYLYTKIRDCKTSNKDFALYASRILRILAEEAVGMVPSSPCSIQTPTNTTYAGMRALDDENSLCVVSILRAGDALMEAVRSVVPQAAVAKILIQRDESSEEKLPKLFYSKIPSDVNSRFCILCDPMLATGGSALCALSILIQEGQVPPDNIIFVCVVAAPEGIRAVHTRHPEVKIVTGAIDTGLNEDKYIVPGLGDFGDRWYNTTGGEKSEA